jgi:aspartyl-tRNA(Asn)/glutamyl-tRNA(Gln) amidotransferase subunit C
MLTEEELQKLAKLSRLEISAEEIPQLQEQFTKMLAHMDSLSKLDLSDVEPLTVVDENTGVMREDVVRESLSQQKAFQNAPAVEQNHFSIPKTI